MSTYILEQYEDSSGNCPFEKWFKRLGGSDAAKIVSELSKMENGNFGDRKGYGAGVMGKRINTGPGYRVYYSMVGGSIVLLLCGGVKSGQARDVAQAKSLLKDYKSRKKEG